MPGKRVHDRPRKAPVQARSIATVEALLGATARILVRRGYAALTTNDVAKRAGVSIGSLYEYFPSKEALVTTLVARHVDHAEAELARVTASLVARGRPPNRTELAQTLASAMLALHEDDPKLHRVLFGEVPHGAALRARVRALEDTYAARLAALFAVMPDVDASNPALSARFVVDLLEATTHRWATDATGTPVEREALAGELTRCIDAYLAPRPVVRSRSPRERPSRTPTVRAT